MNNRGGMAAEKTYTLVHTESSLGWGGQERRIFAEAEVMRQRGHDIILAVDPRGELYNRSRQAGFEVVPFLFGGRHSVSTWTGLRRLLRRRAVDILNTHSSLDSWVGLLALLGQRSRTRLVRTRHLSTPIKSSWPTRWLYRSPDAIITTGQAIKGLIVARTGRRDETIFSIPTGVPLERFYPRPVPQDNLLPSQFRHGCIIGCVAVLRSWKGHLYLVEALEKLVRAGEKAYLVLVGDGPYGAVIREKVSRLNLAEHIYFAGYQDEVPDWLARMDIVVLASYANEGVPQSLLQAMALAKPVIGTICGGIPEIVEIGRNGWLVPPRDSEALAEALMRLLRNPEERAAFGARGLALVQEKYSLEGMAAATEEVYESIVTPQRS
ncbi:MAG: glycosyltransferase family 4 protein [Deltaproteobacteria bacterium]|nr:glycosyltransferase family 4 protein [Deltaproteobacteria bacterium]